jgi:ferritin-like metal-binding protein YciE
MDKTNARDLFVHEVSITLSAELLICELLPVMSEEATNHLLKEGFARHLVESQEQAAKLQMMLDELGGQFDPIPSYPAMGIRQEHDAYVASARTPWAVDVGLLGGALKTEHFEIASYKVLIEAATLMHNGRYVRLLQESLRQEQHTAEMLEFVVAKRLHEETYMAGADLAGDRELSLTR